MQRARLLHLIWPLLLTACAKDPAAPMDEQDTPYALDLPPGAPEVPVPAENALTMGRVALGKALFHEKAMSGDGTLSCASCHLEDHAFSDVVPLSEGTDGAHGFRNSPTLANVAYHPSYFRDGGVPTLELQVLAPLHDPVEMNSNITEVAERLREVEPYRSLSAVAYGRTLDPYVITRSIASYERTLISGRSRFDLFRYQGDPTALTSDELAGWAIFSGATAGCTHCHDGFDLSDHGFHNIGTTLDYSADPGRYRITLDTADIGKFKVPTLRNIALTGPYLHDGSMFTLEEVIDHFASGGMPHPNRSPLLQPFVITPTEKAQLIAFLNSLTDDRSLDQVP